MSRFTLRIDTRPTVDRRLGYGSVLLYGRSFNYAQETASRWTGYFVDSPEVEYEETSLQKLIDAAAFEPSVGVHHLSRL